MDKLLYLVVFALLRTIQAFPLRAVARFGRAAGGVFYWLDPRHRRVAVQNLTACFGDSMSATEIRALAKENFRRLGENYCSAVKTADMTWEELAPHCDFVGQEGTLRIVNRTPAQNLVIAVGHFGNFELYARFAELSPGFQLATTYRGLRQPSLNRLLQSMRERSGCLFFERRTGASALKTAMGGSKMLLGFLADQHAGHGGIRLPFFGRECSTTVAPAVFALRYHCPLITGICFRVGLAQWRIEAGEEIPVRDAAGHPRSTRDITLDMNRAFEAAVRRDPANWFWVHNRWKNPGRITKEAANSPAEATAKASGAASH